MLALIFQFTAFDRPKFGYHVTFFCIGNNYIFYSIKKILLLNFPQMPACSTLARFIKGTISWVWPEEIVCFFKLNFKFSQKITTVEWTYEKETNFSIIDLLCQSEKNSGYDCYGGVIQLRDVIIEWPPLLKQASTSNREYVMRVFVKKMVMHLLLTILFLSINCGKKIATLIQVFSYFGV